MQKRVLSLLRHTNLLSSLNAEEMGALAQSADVVELPGGWEFIREGDEGDYLYAVLDGNLQIFTHGSDGREIVLDRCGAGGYVGEQALLPGSERRRNASVRTSERSTLVRIAREEFQAVLEKDNPLREELVEKGIEQARSILAKQSAVFNSLNLGDAGDWSEEITFTDGQVIFSQGDAGDFYYLIQSGVVAIYRESEGQRDRLAQLGAGQGFGELALLKQTPRQATAIAESEVQAVRIDGASFRTLYEARPELREYVQTLQNVYALRGYGLITQHTGRFMDQDSITTLFHLDDGTRAVSSFVIGRDIFDMRFLPEKNAQVDSLHYRDPTAGIDRELVLAGGRIVSVTVHGLWEELGKVEKMMLDRETMSDEQRANFRQMGRLSPRSELVCSESDVVCECMQTRFGTILEVISDGASTLDEVASQLACGTVCGGCRPRIREILGEGGWTPVAVSEEIEVVPGIRSFRLKSYGKPFGPSLPGQHIVIRAPIEQHWIQRPYTLTSPGGIELDHREVTIKREPDGQFSGWMFGEREGAPVLQVSEPRGDFHADMEQPEPIVCLVGGIGVTPALAMLRSVVRAGFGQPVYVDYSARTADEFVRRDELESLARDHDNIEIRFRATAEDGKISQADIADLVQKYRDARFFICGPGAYQRAVQQVLLGTGVPADRVKVEEFKAVGERAKSQTGGTLLSGGLYAPVGGTLVLLYLLQWALQLEWPWLQGLQATKTYKLWSGFGLVLYMLFQWYLPALRWTGQLQRAAHQYHIHKWVGAFSPLVFYLHSTTLGHTHALVLGTVFLTNTVLALLNAELLQESAFKRAWSKIWLTAHVLLSTGMVGLIIYHAYLAFAYS